MNSSSQRLPTSGETVLINGLVSAPGLNGKLGKIARYVKEKHRYSDKLRLDDGSQKTLAVKPQNISILPSKKVGAGSKIRGSDAFYLLPTSSCLVMLKIGGGTSSSVNVHAV